MSGGGIALKPLPDEIRLAEFLHRTGKLAIAFSGGCDSTLLAGFAARELGAEQVLLVHVNTPLTFRREDDSAREFAVRRGLAYLELNVDALSDPEIVRNDKWRCYHCKKRIFTAVFAAAAERGFLRLADGANTDDRNDWRPGAKAADELGVLHPFSECGIGKRRIRLLSRRMGLPTWNMPAAACLASRIPTGVALTAEALFRCGEAEDVLAKLGFPGTRVRTLADGSASLEFRGVFLMYALRREKRIREALAPFGFHVVTIDRAGYRQGSMNVL